MMNDSVKTLASARASGKGGSPPPNKRVASARVHAGNHAGGPLMLNIDLMSEDPAQPRAANNPGFAAASIAELASTIKLRGVKSPVSVRKNPSEPGRYIINHGARRYRASKVAGYTHIPAFIDDDYSQVDQVIENLQRNELTAREIANWIGREMASGKKKGEIAKSLGKSAAFVSQHVTLLDLPEPIARAFNSARVNDVTVVNELVTAYKKRPAEVSGWLEDQSLELTRGTVKQFRDFLDQRVLEAEDDTVAADDIADGDSSIPEQASLPVPAGPDSGPAVRNAHDSKTKKVGVPIVKVTHDGRAARLNLSRRPSDDGSAWLRYDDDGRERRALLSEVQLVALIVT